MRLIFTVLLWFYRVCMAVVAVGFVVSAYLFIFSSEGSFADGPITSESVPFNQEPLLHRLLALASYLPLFVFFYALSWFVKRKLDE